MAEHRDDHPKLLGHAAAREARSAQLSLPHVSPLTNFVSQLRAEMGPAAHIPNFDPWDGGIDAEVLYLLEAPGRRAVSSGFISRNNPDETAKNFFELNREAGVERCRTIIWNVVPWYIGTDTRIRAATRSDVGLARKALEALLDLLPRLRGVVFIGRAAERAAPTILRLRPTLRQFISPHPSPLFVNNKPGNRERILTVLKDLASFLDRDPAAV